MWPRDIDQQRELMYNEQVKTNALLEQLIELSKPVVVVPQDRSTQKPRRKA